MKRLIGSGSFNCGWLMLFLLLSGLFLFSCEETTGPESVEPTIIYQLLIYPENSTISTGGSTRILVKVYSGSDTTNAVSGVFVNFSSTQAVIQVENNITDSNGYARARLFGGLKAGTIDFTASIQVNSKERYSNKVERFEMECIRSMGVMEFTVFLSWVEISTIFLGVKGG